MSEAADTSEPLIVVCDSNVLYPIVMTDLIISLGSAPVRCRPPAQCWRSTG